MKNLFFWLSNEVAHHSFSNSNSLHAVHQYTTVNSFVKGMNIKLLVCAKKNYIMLGNCTTLPLCSWLKRTELMLYP